MNSSEIIQYISEKGMDNIPKSKMLYLMNKLNNQTEDPDYALMLVYAFSSGYWPFEKQALVNNILNAPTRSWAIAFAKMR